jgi:hypothetical protein
MWKRKWEREREREGGEMMWLEKNRREEKTRSR